MSSEQPSLAQQIEAVEWAAKLIATHPLRLSEWIAYQAALGAAVETLKTLEFARETLP